MNRIKAKRVMNPGRWKKRTKYNQPRPIPEPVWFDAASAKAISARETGRENIACKIAEPSNVPRVTITCGQFPITPDTTHRKVDRQAIDNNSRFHRRVR